MTARSVGRSVANQPDGNCMKMGRRDRGFSDADSEMFIRLSTCQTVKVVYGGRAAWPRHVNLRGAQSVESSRARQRPKRPLSFRTPPRHNVKCRRERERREEAERQLGWNDKRTTRERAARCM